MADQLESRQDDPRINAALADYFERVDRGEAVLVEAFLAEHAGIASELRSLLLTSDDLVQLGPAREVTADAPPEVSTRSVAEQNIETIAPQRVQTPAAGETVLQRLPDSFGRYRIIRLLGSGAMGDVYLAEDSQLQRQVAIKTPSFDADETGELLERFYREARSAAVVRHPNICPVFDVGEINGRHYISMAYIAGQPLSAYVRPDRPQPERQALAVIRKLALALQEAHDHGIIHRDLKPGNVIIDRKGEPIVMDFGLARAVQSEAGARLTQSGMLVGSPAYMSPEQVEGDTSKLTPATDQYSLGVILYELLTGRLPFRGGITAVIGAILTKEPAPPGELRPELDPGVAALCQKMMAKSPAGRFESMRDAAEAIASILRSEPVRTTSTPAAAPSSEAPKAPVRTKKTAGGATAAAVGTAAASVTASSIESLFEAAGKCMRKHDYEQVVQLLEAVPAHKRNDQVNKLLNRARELADEVTFLLAEIDEALRLNDNDALARKADALLKVKPGHRKAAQIKEELSRYGKGRVWQAGGWTPDGRRIGEGSWIPWLPVSVGACVFGISLLCVILYLRVGDAVVRVRISHPDVEVGIQDRTLNIKSANQDIKVEPGEDALTVSFQGAEFQTDKFTLNKGENPAIVVELLDKMLSAKFGDLSIGEWPVEIESPSEGTEMPSPPAADTAPAEMVAILPTGKPPVDAVVFQNHSYKFFSQKTSWHDAMAQCRANQGRLVVIESEAENDFVARLVEREGRVDCWINATDEAAEGTWLSGEGQPLTFTRWSPIGNQPNNGVSGEHFAMLSNKTMPDGTRLNWQWYDQPNESAEHAAGFVCEWDEAVESPAVAAMVAADAVTYQGHSYKYYGERLSWKEAKARCEALGGHLPIVETAAENAFLDRLAHQGFPAGGRQGWEAVWLGATDEKKEGDWKAIDGSSVAYTNWFKMPNNGPGTQPNNKEGREHYALLWLSTDPQRASGLWSDQPDVSQQHVVHFICEWDQAPAATTSASANTEWVELLRNFLPNSRNGQWTFDAAGRLSAANNQGKYCDVSFPADPQGSYEFEFGVVFHAAEIVFLHFPVGDGQASLKLKRRGSDAVSFETGAALNNPGSEILSAALEPDVEHVIRGRIDVQGARARLTGTFNGKPLPEVEGDTASMQAGIRRAREGIWIHVGEGTTATFTQLRYRPITDAATAGGVGWTELFNGRDLSGWTATPDNRDWSASDGILTCRNGVGWLASSREFSDFELSLEYKLPAHGNSGVFLRMPDGGDPTGGDFLEVQLMDDSVPGLKTRQRNGALYGVAAPQQSVVTTANEWQALTVRAEGSVITVLVNGVEVNRCDLDSATAVDSPKFLRSRKGYLGLQQHRNRGDVQFRSVRVREL